MQPNVSAESLAVCSSLGEKARRGIAKEMEWLRVVERDGLDAIEGNGFNAIEGNSGAREDGTV
jgi:hypothetical protein